ncbi:MAG: hypothetical protein LUC37_05600 [Prevotella sp.]|nr:hypothetical protein [Prevotella sp.]
MNKTKDSPWIYPMLFSFKLPDDATITNVAFRVVACNGTNTEDGKIFTKLVKLHLSGIKGSKEGDGGVGENIASQNQSYYQYDSWGEYTYGGSPENVWDVKLTPETVNSSNFGVVYQVANDSDTYCRLKIASVEMKITYDSPTATLTKTTTTSEGTSKEEILASSTIINSAEFKVAFEQDNQRGLLDIYKHNKSTLTITYTHVMGSNGYYNSGGTPETLITASDLRVNDSKRTYSVPITQVKESTESSVITQTVDIYPGTLVGTQSIHITYGETETILYYQVQNSTPDGELTSDAPFSNPSQGFYIDGCTFTNNKSNGNAGAIYLEGSHYEITNSEGSGNQAVSSDKCNNIELNNVCKSFKL